jgi:ATP-binding cassette subfamily B protein
LIRVLSRNSEFAQSTILSSNMSKPFPIYLQHDLRDCGIACLRMVCKHHGMSYSAQHLRSIVIPRGDGINLFELGEGAEKLGLRSFAARVSINQLLEKVPTPCIVHWEKNHYVVVYKLSKRNVWIGDPAQGLLKLSLKEFKEGFLSLEEDGQKLGIALILDPVESKQGSGQQSNSSIGRQYIKRYLSENSMLLFQLIFGLCFTVLLQVVFPFLIMGIVDEGVNNQDFSFVKLVALAWLILYLSQILIEHLRQKIFLQIGARTNLSLVSDFLINLFKLPLSFFSGRHTSDITRRLYDGERVERILTTSFLPGTFAVIGILLSASVLAYFDLSVFLVFVIGLFLYFLIVILTGDKQKQAAFRRYDVELENQLKLEEIVNGIQDIKLNNAETMKRWDWERSEARLFKQEIQYNQVSQRLALSTKLVNEVKNIAISCLSAKAVIDGTLSLGALFGIQYLVGQMNIPIIQLKALLLGGGSAQLSLDRMHELANVKDEPLPEKFKYIPEKGDILFEQVEFTHEGTSGQNQLTNLNFKIERGKTTAIVGSSGSGKSSILKLLLGIAKPDSGQIRIGNTNLNSLEAKSWNKACSYVLQDSYIFSDTIADNIVLSEGYINEERLRRSTQLANINRFIEDLPLGYHTKIGKNGMDLSKGQLQRILLARAFYKNGDFLILDEATSALDGYNELMILDSIEEEFKNKTKLIVSHRLSAVRSADNILVMESGELVEQGNHLSLMERKGAYYRLFSSVS